MKRITVLLLLSVMMMFATGNVFAEEAIDFSSMKTEEIFAVINSGYTELLLRAESNLANKVIYDEGGITILLTGDVIFEEREQNDDYLEIGLIIINDTDSNYCIESHSMYINGWQIGNHLDGGTVAAHTKSKNNQFKFYGLADLAGSASLSDIEFATITINLTKLDSDFRRLEGQVTILGPVMLVYTEEGFLVVPYK